MKNRKNLEKLGQEDESILSSLFQVIPDLIFRFGSDGKILDYRAQRNSDLYVPPEVFLGKSVEEVLPPPAAAGFRAALDAALTGSGIRLFEYDLPLEAGSRHFECRMSRIGNERQCIAIVRDTTEQFQDKQALLASENRFKNLLEQAPFSVIIARVRDCGVLYFNRRAKELFAVPSEGSRDLFMENFFADAEDRKAIHESVLNGFGAMDREIRMTSLHEKPFWALASASVVDYLGEPSVMFSISNIDDRKRTHLELDHERTRLKTLFRTIPDMLWVRDSEGRYLNANPVFERIYGRSESEISGKTDADFLSREEADSFLESDKRAIEKAGQLRFEEWLKFSGTDRKGLFEVMKTPMYDGEGRLIGVLGIAHEITEIRRNQRDLRERVKEQKCLNRIFALTEDIDALLDRQLRLVVESIPSGWLHPEITAVRLSYSGVSLTTENFRETPWRISVENTTRYGLPVSLTIVYLEEGQAEDVGPFLMEEYVLAKEITRRLVSVFERRKEAEGLKERELLLATMFAQTTDSIVIADAETGAFLDFNDAAAKSLGYTREEFSRLKASDIQAEHTSIEIAENSRRSAGGELINFETLHRHKDGSQKNVLLTIRPVRIGGKIALSAVWRDITEQKARERELDEYRLHLEDLVAKRTADLRMANDEQQAIFDSATTGIVFLKDRRILRCNKKLEDLFGYGPGELIGQSTILWYDNEETYQAVGKEIRESLAATGQHRAEKPLRRKDGSTFWARMSAQKLIRDDSSVAMVGIVEDITAEREATETLRAAKEAAEAATEAKSNFLANMSHEIRTPMNAIIGMAHLLMKTELNAKQKDFIEKLQISGQHLLGIINDILDLSKIEAGKLDIERMEFNLEQVMNSNAGLLMEKADDKGLEFYIDIAEDVPRFLVGDPLRIGQLILNYGSNAIKFTEKGEIGITVRLRELTPQDAVLYFAIRDTGIGLTEGQMQNLFRSFQQADMSTTRKFGGTGLGLVICKRLAELMGGEVGVESELGRGSTFWFTLRLGLGTSKKAVLAPHPDLRGCRVLVVDDNMTFRVLFQGMLKNITIEASVAASGSEALKELQRASDAGKPYKIVFLDWKMPELDGMETAIRIRDLNLEPRPNIVLVTGSSGDTLPKPAFETGIRHVLRKPITQSTLFDAIIGLFHEKENADTGKAAPGSAPAEIEKRLSTIAGARILLVEDNEINQEVALGLLSESGFVVDAAENGAVALEMLKKERYNLVLMDIQMPVMDGISATLAVRKDPEYNGLPIVAMTANAMHQDKIDCLTAGMNDFIAKPIDPEKLRETLLKWIPPVKRGPELPLQEKRVAAGGEENLGGLTEIPGLDVQGALRRLLGRKSLYVHLVRKFLSGHAGAAEAVRAALRAGDRTTANRIAHTVKGVAGNLGAEKLRVAAETLEKALVNAPDSAPSEALTVFEDELERIVSEFKEKLPAADGHAAGEIDPEKTKAVCASLLVLLRDGDLAVTDLLASHRATLAAAYPEDFPRIEAAIRDFDLDLAANVLEKAMIARPLKGKPKGGSA